MTDTGTFMTATILTAYRSKFLIDDIGKLYDFLSFMTGDRLATHQLVPAADALKPAMREQLPWLDDVPVLPPIPDDVPAKKWVEDYLTLIEDEHGMRHELRPAPHLWGEHDPLADLEAIRDGKPVVVAVAPETGR